MEKLDIAVLEQPLLQNRERPKRFVKAFDLGWILAAMRLGGKCCAIGVILQFVSGLTRSNKVRVSPALLASAGIHRRAWYRGLRRMERAGLVSAIRKGHSRPEVTILEQKSPPSWFKCHR